MGYLENLIAKREEVHKKTSSNKGKFTVLGIDMFSNEDYPIGKYDTREEAFRVASKKAKEALKWASGPDIADRYYVYDSEGKYLGQGS